MTLGPQTEQNPYIAELAAIEVALSSPPVYLHNRTITVLSSNQAALLAIQKPQQQSRQIYSGAQMLRDRGNTVRGRWVPVQQNHETGGLAKGAAKKATEPGKTAERHLPQAKATILTTLKRAIKAERTLPNNIGKQSQDVDAALPDKHTKEIYDTLNNKEAGVLAQLRTGMARINGYLHRIGVPDTDQCGCKAAKETAFSASKRLVGPPASSSAAAKGDEDRRHLLLPGRKSRNLEVVPSPWKPNMTFVRATLRYAIVTGRLLANEQLPH